MFTKHSVLSTYLSYTLGCFLGFLRSLLLIHENKHQMGERDMHLPSLQSWEMGVTSHSWCQMCGRLQWGHAAMPFIPGTLLSMMERDTEPRVEIIITKIVLVSLQIPSSLPEVFVRRWVSDLPLSAQRSWSFRCPSCRSWYSLRGMLWSWICWLDDWYAMRHAMIIKPSAFLQLLTNRTSKNQFPLWLQFWSLLWISSGCCIFSHYDS